jgi:general secretion pathway protein G
MMMLATGSATDGAEATKVINDLRNLKGAALMFFVDEQQWPTGTDGTSLDSYMDRAFLDGNVRYDGLLVASADVNGTRRSIIGLQLKVNDTHRAGVQKKLAGSAKNSGLYDAAGDPYTGGADIYMAMN